MAGFIEKMEDRPAIFHELFAFCGTENIVNAGLHTEQWEMTRKFIDQWKDNLPEEYRENLYLFTQARWHYSQKQLDEAQQLLNQVEFKDLLLSVSVRTLLIRVYFEADEDDLLFAALEANRIYLLRNKQLQPTMKTQLQNFIDYTRKLYKLFPRDKETLEAFKDNLPPANEIMHRDWLILMCQ